MNNQSPEFKVTDIIEEVLQKVIQTRDTDVEVKAHAAKMILYRDYNVNVSFGVLKKRLVEKGVH
jgi:hypothetical protein